MKNLYRALLAGALPLLVGCHTEPKETTTQSAVNSPAAPRATAPAITPNKVAPPFVGYHRYRGTVGGRPVTVELTIDSTQALLEKKLTCTGSYYYGQANAGQLNLSAKGTYLPQQPLQLQETDGDRATGTWQATQPAGPVLAGTWRSASGKQLPFSLHEDYTDGRGQLMAVHYEVVSEASNAPCHPEREEGETKADYRTRIANAPSEWSMEFLHLLGPDTLRPVLRKLQCPVPAKRQQLLRKAMQEADCETQVEYIQVNYNDYGLLATTASGEGYSMGAAHPRHGVGQQVVDLRTGHELMRAEVFQPGTDLSLSQLITRHLADEYDIKANDLLTLSEIDSTLAPLPHQEFGMTVVGLAFQYNEYEITPYVIGSVSVTIPYEELLPLLRPTSPVARMLRERGLWRRQ